MPRALECRPRSLALAPELAWLLSLQWLWEETSSLPARTYQQVDRSFSRAFQSTSWTSCPHKFQALISSRAVASTHDAEEHALYVVPSSHRAVYVSRHRHTLWWWRGGSCSDDAEVGDFQTKIFYTLIRSGLASLWTLLLGNIFRFRAIICSAKNENIVNIINVARTQWVQNFNLSR